MIIIIIIINIRVATIYCTWADLRSGLGKSQAIALSYRHYVAISPSHTLSHSLSPTCSLIKAMVDSVKYTPPPSPPSPSTSFYDVSDDDEGEYNTIAHAASGRGVKLLYSKSKVRLPSMTSVFPALTIFPGLCASHSLRQGQHSWLHSPHPAEASPIRPVQHCLVSPFMGAGILVRRCLQHICQG